MFSTHNRNFILNFNLIIIRYKPFKGVIFARLKIQKMSKISTLELEERKAGKDLYSYQKGAINKIFKLLKNLQTIIICFINFLQVEEKQ